MLWFKLVLFPLLFSSQICDTNGREYWGPTPMQYIRKFNYSGEKHQVQTADGYILTLYRIRNRSTTKYRRPILIVHGLTSRAGHFLLTATSPAFFLANFTGTDVWLMNARGTIWSRHHIKYDPQRNYRNFWNFSWHEIGFYDIPVTIDYILNVTNWESLFYIGHSQGGTTFCVMTAMRPEYNRKIKMAVLLAPTVLHKYTNDSPTMDFIMNGANEAQRALKKDDLYRFEIEPQIRQNLAKFCTFRWNHQYCSKLIRAITHVEIGYLNEDTIPNVIWASPSPVGIRQLIHYIQNIQSGEFAQYDFGPDENLIRYGTKVPPPYNLGRISAPVHLYYSHRDFIVPSRNIVTLGNILPNLMKSYIVPRGTFDHCDYVLANDTNQLVYQEIFNDIEKIT